VTDDDKGFWIGLGLIALFGFAVLTVAAGALLKIGWNLF
jgi:hypothetical protein